MKCFYKAEMNKILDEINRHASQKYLTNHLNYPTVSLLKLRLLFLYFFSQSSPTKQNITICTATALVQMGLDIHEQVSNQQELKNDKILKRQLQVLAGDFFSSKYYELLAYEGEIEAINKLALGVNLFNQQKVTLHELESRIHYTPTEWIQVNVEIESALLKCFMEENSEWSQLIEQFMQLHYLHSVKLPVDWKPSFIKNLLETSYSKTQVLIAHVKNDLVKKELINLLDTIYPTSIHSLVAEEI